MCSCLHVQSHLQEVCLTGVLHAKEHSYFEWLSGWSAAVDSLCICKEGLTAVLAAAHTQQYL